MRAKLSRLVEADVEYVSLQKEHRDLNRKIARYHRHLEQYAKCRDEIKRVEDSLKFGDKRCIVFRDFVNCYNERGDKVKNLVLVKITRSEDGDLIVDKIHNFCTDKASGCDAYYVADVFDHHFKAADEGGSGLFDEIETIYLAGDHGPHFSCIQTVYNESCFWKTTGSNCSNFSPSCDSIYTYTC